MAVKELALVEHSFRLRPSEKKPKSQCSNPLRPWSLISGADKVTYEKATIPSSQLSTSLNLELSTACPITTARCYDVSQ
jgi:hypothetical protein